MTEEMAMRILDPESTGETLRNYSVEERRRMIDDACILAVAVLKRYQQCHVFTMDKDSGTLSVIVSGDLYADTNNVYLIESGTGKGKWM